MYKQNETYVQIQQNKFIKLMDTKQVRTILNGKKFFYNELQQALITKKEYFTPEELVILKLCGEIPITEFVQVTFAAWETMLDQKFMNNGQRNNDLT